MIIYKKLNKKKKLCKILDYLISYIKIKCHILLWSLWLEIIITGGLNLLLFSVKRPYTYFLQNSKKALSLGIVICEI